MSLRNFTDEIHNRQLYAEARGYKLSAIYVSPTGEDIIIKGAMKEANDNVKLPELEIHGVRVKKHEKMPSAQVWYVFTGGKT